MIAQTRTAQHFVRKQPPPPSFPQRNVKAVMRMPSHYGVVPFASLLLKYLLNNYPLFCATMVQIVTRLEETFTKINNPRCSFERHLEEGLRSYYNFQVKRDFDFIPKTIGIARNRILCLVGVEDWGILHCVLSKIRNSFASAACLVFGLMDNLSEARF